MSILLTFCVMDLYDNLVDSVIINVLLCQFFKYLFIANLISINGIEFIGKLCHSLDGLMN